MNIQVSQPDIVRCAFCKSPLVRQANGSHRCPNYGWRDWFKGRYDRTNHYCNRYSGPPAVGGMSRGRLSWEFQVVQEVVP